MAGPEVTKKVRLLGSWNEDIFSDEIIKSISARAKLEKGKKVKVTLNEAGIKLTRSRFFQENKLTFFPIKDLKTVTRSPEVSKCVLFILSDPERKYKIIALKCASQADSLHLINVSAEIQRSKQSADVELEKRENGNWTLRGKRGHTSGRHVIDAFSDIKPSSEVSIMINGSVAHRPEPSGPPVATSASYTKGVYSKRYNAGSSSSQKVPGKMIDDQTDVYDDSDNFVIETAVVEHPYQAYTRHNVDEINQMKARAMSSSLNTRKDGGRRQDDVANKYVIETEILPYQGSPKQSHSRKYHEDVTKVETKGRHTSVNISSDGSKRRDDVDHGHVIETETLPHRYSVAQPDARQISNEIKKLQARDRNSSANNRSDGSRLRDEADHSYGMETVTLPHRYSVGQPPDTRQISNEIKKLQARAANTSMNNRADGSRRRDEVDHGYVVETETSPRHYTPGQMTTLQNSNEIKKLQERARRTPPVDYSTGNRRQDSDRSQIYSKRNISPTRSLVYTTSSRAPIATQPVFYREPPRTYEARIEPPTAYYINPLVSKGRPSSVQSELVPVRILGKSWNAKYDQRSLRSNNSKSSQSKKRRSSPFPSSTIVRAIEDTYPRPAVIMRSDQILGYRPRPASYHVMTTNEMLMNPDVGTPL